MKTLTFIFLFIALAASAFAQTDKPITEWIDLNLPDDEFALQAPKGFEFENSGYSDDKVTTRGEFHSDRDRFYIFIDPLKDPSQRKHVAAFLSFVNQDTSKMELAPHVAARAQFEDTMGYFHRVVFVKTASRIFTLQTVSSAKNSEHAVRFLNSFRLLPKAGPGGSPTQSGLEINQDSDAKLPVETDTQAPFRPFVGGGGVSSGDAGRGSGNESGSGSGSTLSPLPSPTPSSPLRITFKLKAQYTDFARFYMVQGYVTLRVTFLASGQIGSVTTIKRLPFGLTESAIYAAQHLRFEPEIVNGVARTTSRPVSFAFTIY